MNNFFTQPRIGEPGFWNAVLSVLAAAFGVQSKTNQHRDFSQGRLRYFIIAGLLFTALFIVVVLGIAKIAKEQTQPTPPTPTISPQKSVIPTTSDTSQHLSLYKV